MAFSVRVFIFLAGMFLFMVILELVRRKKFREELSLVWLLIGVLFILSSFADLIIDPVAKALGINYPPVLVFMVVFFFLVLAILYFSIVVSDLKSKNKELSQKIALMEYKINKTQTETDTDTDN